MQNARPGYHCSGDGEAVVLLHATLSSKRQWKALIPLLSERYRVIAVDLYGYGDTPLPEGSVAFTLRDEVELVCRLVDPLLGSGATFHLVGHSYGGAVALAFCHYYPGRVRTLCAFEPVSFHLLDLAHPDLAPLLQMARSLDRYTAEGKPDQAARTFLDYWGGAGSYDQYPARIREEFAARTPKLRFDFQAITHTPITLEECRQLPMPVHLIVGSESRRPALLVSEVLSSTLPRCTVQKVQAGHLAPLTHPELVNPLIVQSLG